MTLIVAGTVRVAPEKLEALRPHAIDMIRATRQEHGCIAYAFSDDLAQPGLIHIFEIWRDEEALKAHGASEHMKVWRAAAGALGVADRQLKTYEIASEKVRP